jgi:hypothetical protein
MALCRARIRHLSSVQDLPEEKGRPSLETLVVEGRTEGGETKLRVSVHMMWNVGISLHTVSLGWTTEDTEEEE